MDERLLRRHVASQLVGRGICFRCVTIIAITIITITIITIITTITTITTIRSAEEDVFAAEANSPEEAGWESYLWGDDW